MHGLCVKHWATDCSPLATCSLCKHWTNEIWSQVYDLYASMTESGASNMSQQGNANDLDLATIPSPGKSINSGNTIVDAGSKPTPSNNVSKTRKKKKSKTTKLTPTAISSVKPASGKRSMISTVDNVSNVSNIISLQASPSTCGMVEAGEVDLGVGRSHCTDQIEQSPLVPRKAPGPDLGSVVEGEGFSQLIQELVKRPVEATEIIVCCSIRQPRVVWAHQLLCQWRGLR